MDYIHAIEQRTSRRSFQNTPIAAEKLELLKEQIALANEQSGLTIQYLEDGSDAFEGVKSYGMFHGVRAMLVLKGDRQLEHRKEKAGYYGERLILVAQELGLGSCWVGGTFDRQSAAFAAAPDEEIVCVVPIGNVSAPTVKEKVIRGMIHRSTKSIEEMVRTDRPLTGEETAAMRLVQLAPTAKNTQKVVFSFYGETITASVPDDYPFDLVDLGICKLHFEEGMKALFPQGYFRWGNGGAFQTN